MSSGIGASIVQTAISTIGGIAVIYAFYFVIKWGTSFSDNRARKRIDDLPFGERAAATRRLEERVANDRKREKNWIWFLLFLVFGAPLVMALIVA